MYNNISFNIIAQGSESTVVTEYTPVERNSGSYQSEAALEADFKWKIFVDALRRESLDAIIDDEKLKPVETYHFVSNAFRDGILKTVGGDIDIILPPVSRFGGGNRDEKKNRVIDRLKAYYEMFIDIFFGDDTLDK